MLTNLGRYSITASDNIVRERSAPELRTPVNAAVTSRKPITASLAGASASGGHGTTGASIVANYARSVIEDFINPDDVTTTRRVYKDIYYHDSVSGSAVDLLSTLPWSDFTLTGVPNASQLTVYAQSVENLALKSLLPEISIDYLVQGAFVGALNFDSDANVFTSIMPQDLAMCDITELPVYGMDPLIDVRIPANITKLFQRASSDPRLAGLMARVPDFISKDAAKGRVSLNPANTLYIPRRTLSTTSLGTSYFRRILPLYLLEKALLRGTIESAYRRQRGILHLVAGTDEWEPTNEELSAINNMFIAANMDPTGAVIATRDGIQVNEVRNGSDFWRYDEIYDFLTSAKLKALGVTESLISGDASYSNMETALTVFIEQLRSYREMIVRRVFMTKIFPAIAVANDFRKTQRQRLETTGSMRPRERYEIVCDGNSLVPDMKDVDITEYHLPRINWHKSLKPEADQDYMTMLDTLEQKGVPVTMRMYAAAAGVSLTELMGSLDDDLRIRKRIQSYQKQKPKTNNEMQEMLASLAKEPKEVIAEVLSGKRTRRVGLGARDFSAFEEQRDPDTGRTLTRKGKRVLEERANKRAAQALAAVAKKTNAKVRKNREESTTTHYIGRKSIFGITAK